MSIIIYNNGKFSKAAGNSKQFSGEKMPGDLASWDYYGTDPNIILTTTYDILSQRSTTLYHTHPPVTSAVNKMTQYAIGGGLIFRSQPDWETLGITKAAAKDWGMRFQKLVHYVFQILNYYEKQSILFRTALVQGDSLLFFDRKDVEKGMPFDLFETGGDQINFEGNTSRTDLSVTLGILHDDYFRKKGIIQTDGTEAMFADGNRDQNVLQCMFKNMARQLRGFPLSYRIIAAAKNNDRWWDATLSRLVMETIMLGVSNDDSGEDTLYDQSSTLADSVKNEDNSTPASTISEDASVRNMTGGNILSYKGKGKIEFSDLKTPSNNFDKVQNAYIEMVGMAMDVPPEVILSKYSTSYTAHKGAFNDFIKSFMFYRSRFANNINKIVVREIAKYLFIEKLIEMPNIGFFDNAIIQEATIAGNWLGTVPGHINPAQEVQAKKMSVEEGFDLRSNIAKENGHEWDNFIEEWQQEQEEWQKGALEKKASTLQKEITQQDEEDESNTQDDNNNQGGQK